jgi:hypothetical protein
MLYKCANEACYTPFRRLREGKLFQVETEYFAEKAVNGTRRARRGRPWRRVEHYWLCDQCASYVTLTFDRKRGVVTVPLPDGSGQKIVTVVSPTDEAAISEPSGSSSKSLREVGK